MNNNEPRAMREIHEIQEKIFEKEKLLSASERIVNANRISQEMIKKFAIRCKIKQRIK